MYTKYILCTTIFIHNFMQLIYLHNNFNKKKKTSIQELYTPVYVKSNHACRYTTITRNETWNY